MSNRFIFSPFVSADLENEDYSILSIHNEILSDGNTNISNYIDEVIQRTKTHVANNYVYLSGNNTALNNHAISGNNDFINGLNSFENISALNASITSANINNLSVINSTNENLLVKNLSSDWCNIVDTKSNVGFSLYDLSIALSNKIWIEDRIDETISSYSDLSIVKITADDYYRIAATKPSMLCSNTIYVVENDYINAYDVEIRNLSTPGVDNTSNAANVDYVQQEITNAITKLTDADLQTLSNQISTKIWISCNGTAEYSNLSIVELTKADYDKLSPKKNCLLSNNVLYIEKSDFIDAYSCVISNLSTSGIDGVSPAANTEYVDKQIEQISSTNIQLSTSEYISAITNIEQINGKINISAVPMTIDHISGLTDFINTKVQQKFSTNELSINQNSKLSDIISAVIALWSGFGGHII